MSGYWEELERPAPDSVHVQGAEVRAGSRVCLRPRAGADVFDLALAGRAAVVEAIEQDLEGEVRLAVVVEDDPGRDLGLARQPGHRFFFSLEEVEPLTDLGPPAAARSFAPRILVAGIGNVFLGDDGFGVAVADRLWRRELPAGVEVVAFGIRGMDLAFAMQDGYDAVVLLDAAPRGGRPGTLYVIEVDSDDAEVTVDAHGMDPVAVMRLARSLGTRPPRTLLVGCEPQTHISPEDEEIIAQLSEPVLAAIDPAVTLVESLLEQIRDESPKEVRSP
jgi:hydrogenase maturation protease